MPHESKDLPEVNSAGVLLPEGNDQESETKAKRKSSNDNLIQKKKRKISIFGPSDGKYLPSEQKARKETLQYLSYVIKD